MCGSDLGDWLSNESRREVGGTGGRPAWPRRARAWRHPPRRQRKARKQTDRRRSRGKGRWKPAGSRSVPDSAIFGPSLVGPPAGRALQAPSGISMESHAGSGAPVVTIAEEEEEKREEPDEMRRIWRRTAGGQAPRGPVGQPLSDSGTRIRGPPVDSLLFCYLDFCIPRKHLTPRVDESTSHPWRRHDTTRAARLLLDRSRVQLQCSCALFLLRRHDGPPSRARDARWSLAAGHPRAPPTGHLPFSSRGGCQCAIGGPYLAGHDGRQGLFRPSPRASVSVAATPAPSSSAHPTQTFSTSTAGHVM